MKPTHSNENTIITKTRSIILNNPRASMLLFASATLLFITSSILLTMRLMGYMSDAKDFLSGTSGPAILAAFSVSTLLFLITLAIPVTRFANARIKKLTKNYFHFISDETLNTCCLEIKKKAENYEEGSVYHELAQKISSAISELIPVFKDIEENRYLEDLIKDFTYDEIKPIYNTLCTLQSSIVNVNKYILLETPLRAAPNDHNLKFYKDELDHLLSSANSIINTIKKDITNPPIQTNEKRQYSVKLIEERIDGLFTPLISQIKEILSDKSKYLTNESELTGGSVSSSETIKKDAPSLKISGNTTVLPAVPQENSKEKS